jgi:hypothetical protein
MWDEQERFAGLLSKFFFYLMAVFGIILAALSFIAGNPAPFVGFLLLLAGLAAMTLLYGLVAVSIGGVLLGISRGLTYCFRCLRNHCFNHPLR